LALRSASTIHEGQDTVSSSHASRFITRVVEMLKSELGAYSPRIKQEAGGIRCAVPSAGAFLVVHSTVDRVYWETVPVALNDSQNIKSDRDWDTAYTELESQVRGWVATL